jgi:hypothetical protein
MLCTTCGKNNNEKASYCRQCGAVLGSSSNKVKKKADLPTSINAKKRNWKPVLVGVLVFVLVMASIFTIKILSRPSLVSEKEMTIAEDWSLIQDAKTPDANGFVKQYYENVTFTIHEQVRGEDGTGIAKVTVVSPDMEVILNEVFTTLKNSKEQDKQVLAEQVQDRFEEWLGQDHKVTTMELEVPIRRIDDTWMIVPTTEWNNAITGNMAGIFRAYYAEMLREDAE